MRWLRATGGLLRRSSSGVVVLVVAVALGGTIFGLGAMGQSPDVFDGSAWLWSRSDGEMTQVSSTSGEVDLRQPVIDSRGHHLQVTQNDQYLLLHDLDTGQVTSVDLTRMGFSGKLSAGVQNDVVVVLSGTLAAVVDRTRGLIRAVDPGTLQVKGESLQLPAPLVGGTFDGQGTLWVGLPQQGTVVGLSTDGGTIAARVTVPVAQPGHDIVISALDKGVLAVDRSSKQIVAVIGDKPKQMTAPVTLAGALVPDRTVGSLAAVTVPAAQAVVTIGKIEEGGPVRSLPLPKKDSTAVAVPFAGRVYVPDNESGIVQIYNSDGKSAGKVTMKDAGGVLELQVREQHLFINAPDTRVASVVDPDGKVRTVEKYRPDPVSSASADPSTEPSLPATGGPIGVPSPTQTPTAGDGKQDGNDGGNDSGGNEGSTPIDPKPTVTKPPQKTEPPGAPVPVTALAGDEQVSLNWGRAAQGSAAVTRYTVTWNGGSRSVDGNALKTVVSGLTNGKTYRFRVMATNRYGEGPPALSGPVTPVDGTPPNAPSKPTATAAVGTVKVTWPAVADAREYVVTPLREGAAGADPEQRVPGTETEFTGLAFGKSYTFTVVAVDAEGRASAASPASNAVLPYGVPTAPKSVTGKQTGANKYRVTWAAATANGKPITKYVVSDAAGNVLGTAGPDARNLDVTATALTKVQVAAENSAGRGKSATATVTAIKAPTVTITSSSAKLTSVTVKFTVTDGSGAATCAITITPSGKKATGCGGTNTFTGLSAGTAYTVKVAVTNQVASDSASKKQVTYSRGTVTCKDKASNPDPVYCTATGGIGVFKTPKYSAGNDDHRVKAGSAITVVCRDTGSAMNASVYNNNKHNNIWLKMSDGFWISWVWVTLSGGDDVKAVPTCS